MTLGSLFDGVGMWLLSAERNGIRPVWASEVEAFPISVTKKHFPYVKHLGDVRNIKGDEVEPVDILCAGSPCQSLSVAGKRKGLADESRSGLFIEAIRLLREMREATDGKYPRFFLWENVTGAFSSNKGRDFCAVLEYITEASIPMPENNRWANSGMVESPACTVTWTVLDASVFGVPQRRNRIFLVADFGEAKERKPQILFEPESLRGNPAKSRESGEEVARKIDEGSCEAVAVRERAGCAGGGKGLLYSADQSLTLQTTNDQMIYSMAHACDVIRESEGVSPTLTHRMGTGGNNVPLVQCLGGQHPNAAVMEDKAPTLTEAMGAGGGHVPLVSCFGASSFGTYSEHPAPLKASGGDMGGGEREPYCGSLTADMYKGVNNQMVSQNQLIVEDE